MSKAYHVSRDARLVPAPKGDPRKRAYTRAHMFDEKQSLANSLSVMPVFPLSGVTLFPRALLPLHIFESRYREMLKDALATNGMITIAHVPDPEELDEHGRHRIAQIAGAGLIVEHRSLPDGRSNVLLRGVARVRLSERDFVPPYRRARAEVLHDENATSVATADRTALLAAASAFAGEIHRREKDFDFRLPESADVSEIADLCAQYLVEDVDARQRILEARDVALRVRIVTTEIAVQHRRLSGPGTSALN